MRAPGDLATTIPRVDAPPRPAARRGLVWQGILFAAATMLALAAIRHAHDLAAMATDLGALALVLISLRLFKAARHEEIEAHAEGRRPHRLQRLTWILAAIFCGPAVGLMLATLGTAAAVSGGVTATILHLAAFGGLFRDTSAQEGAPAARAAAQLATARAWLDEIEGALAACDDPALEATGARFAASVRRLVATATVRPGTAAEMREHLGVMLHGAHDAALRLGEIGAGPNRNAACREFQAFLADLTLSYEEKAGTLDAAAREEMALEMDLVRDRMRRRPRPDSED